MFNKIRFSTIEKLFYVAFALFLFLNVGVVIYYKRQPAKAPPHKLVQFHQLNKQNNNHFQTTDLKQFIANVVIALPILGDYGFRGNAIQQRTRDLMAQYCDPKFAAADVSIGSASLHLPTRFLIRTRANTLVSKTYDTPTTSRCSFVLTLGDNFYLNGVASLEDSHFQETFENVYVSPSLQIPFLSILGNHDYMQQPQVQAEYTYYKGLLSSEPNGKFFLADARRYITDIFIEMETQALQSTPSEEPRDFSASVTIVLDDEAFLQTVTEDENVKLITSEDLEGGLRLAEDNKRYLYHMARIVHMDTEPFKGIEHHEVKKGRIRPEEILSQNTTQQIEWVEQRLKEANPKWKFVCGHHPIHSWGNHGATKELYPLLKPLLTKYKVNAHFSGHDHIAQYVEERTDENAHSIHYFVSGLGSQLQNPSERYAKKRVPGEKFEKEFFFAEGPTILMAYLTENTLHTRFINESSSLLSLFL